MKSGFSFSWLYHGGRPSGEAALVEDLKPGDLGLGGTALLAAAPSNRPVQRVRGGVLLALWVFVSLLSVGPSYLHYLAERQPVPWSRLFSEMTGWYLWVLVFPLILWAARRFPLDGRTWRTSLPIHLLIGSVVAVLYGVLVLLKNQAIFIALTGDTDPHLLSLVPGYLIGGFQFYLLIYSMLAAMVFAVDYYRMYRERELRAIELEGRLSKAHLQMLKMQLEPHFLFNTLNAISALLHREPEKADRMVGLLGDFLRASLHGSNRQETALRQELELLEHYLEIEEVRFGDRLTVNWDIQQGALQASVPALLLQPLIENSIRHGIDAQDGKLTIEIAARRGGDRLEIQVTDNGPGFPEPTETVLSRGIGISNTVARLRRLYNDEHTFELRNRETGGAVVSISIPLRLHGAG